MRLWLWRLAVAVPLCLTLWSLATLLRDNPLAQPFVERGTAEVQRRIERAMAWRVTPDWLQAELEQALSDEDAERARTLVQIAADHGLSPAPDQLRRLETLEARDSGALARAGDCMGCMAEIGDCPSLQLIAICGIPFELTPAGDLNALRRGAMAAFTGAEPDRIEVALALVGLGATAAILVSGGTSTTVKAGATGLRLARRLGTLTPRFSGELLRLSDVGTTPGRLWAYLLGRAPLEETADMARLARLGAVASDLGRVARATGPADTLALLRHVDTAEDAARLARVADAAGPATRGVMETLGAPRVFRMLVRLSDAALGVLTLAWLALVQLGTALAGMAGSRLVRALRPRPG